jgi:hypothetical protein
MSIARRAGFTDGPRYRSMWPQCSKVHQKKFTHIFGALATGRRVRRVIKGCFSETKGCTFELLISPDADKMSGLSDSFQRTFDQCRSCRLSK